MKIIIFFFLAAFGYTIMSGVTHWRRSQQKKNRRRSRK